jgi:hypothetical protein
LIQAIPGGVARRVGFAPSLVQALMRAELLP